MKIVNNKEIYNLYYCKLASSLNLMQKEKLKNYFASSIHIIYVWMSCYMSSFSHYCKSYFKSKINFLAKIIKQKYLYLIHFNLF